jgi:endo-1,3-1,4-beta-glycanase ExoK
MTTEVPPIAEDQPLHNASAVPFNRQGGQPRTKLAHVVAAVVFLLCVCSGPTLAQTVPDPLPSFSDEFAIRDDDAVSPTSTWQRSDGWTNGSPFNVGWLADHVLFNPTFAPALNGSRDARVVALLLDNIRSSRKPYASGEYRTRLKASYGTVSGRIKPPKGSGVISSLFTYTGPSEGDPWDEIDIEFLGRDTTKMQVNYFTNGVGGHETTIDLGFDAALAYHEYAFKWEPDSITWYVDGIEVHKETGGRGPLPARPGRIFVNLWAGDNTVMTWLGRFKYTKPIYAYYDSVSYTALPITITSALP